MQRTRGHGHGTFLSSPSVAHIYSDVGKRNRTSVGENRFLLIV
jgi:hypothetical protein